VPGKLPVSYVLTGNLLTGKLPVTNITGNLRTLVPMVAEPSLSPVNSVELTVETLPRFTALLVLIICYRHFFFRVHEHVPY